MLLLTGLASSSFAASKSGTLKGPRQQERWHISTSLTSYLDEHRLDVSLPPGIWSKPGALQIAIRWEDEAEDLELRVTAPDGTVYESASLPSTAESIHVPNAVNGQYRIAVSSNTSAEVPYEALAEVEYTTNPQPLRDLRPDLISLPPRHLTFETGAYYTETPDSATSCYPEETAEQGAIRCLRFDQIIGNQGAGPFELRYQIPDSNLVSLTEHPVRQRIYRSDGGFTDRDAAEFEYHPTHAHFHYKEFAQSLLYESDAAGNNLRPDRPARTGEKNGFCMIDVENWWFGLKGDAARTYRFPGCMVAPGREMVNGISVGWADVYNWYLPDQYIEVSGLSGYYLLQTVIDPELTVLESDETNNCNSVLIEILDTEANIIGPPKAC